MMLSKRVVAFALLSSIAEGLKVSLDAHCGASFGLTCAGSRFGNCCSKNGWCGSTPAYCAEGCQSKYGTCSTPAKPVSKNGRCGASNGGQTCLNSVFGNCCSNQGYCGRTGSYCGGYVCQKEYGSCEGSPAPSSVRTTLSSIVSTRPASSRSSVQPAPTCSARTVTLSGSVVTRSITQTTTITLPGVTLPGAISTLTVTGAGGTSIVTVSGGATTITVPGEGSTITVPGEGSTITVTGSASTVTLPEEIVTVTVPTTVTLPEDVVTVTVPTTVTLPEEVVTVTVPTTVTLPEDSTTVTVPTTVTLPGENELITVTVPTTVTLPGEEVPITVTIPAQTPSPVTVTLPAPEASTVTLPANTVTLPAPDASTVTLPAQTPSPVIITLPAPDASTVTLPANTVTLPAPDASTVTVTLPAVTPDPVTVTATPSVPALTCPSGDVVVNGGFESALTGNWFVLTASSANLDRVMVGASAASGSYVFRSRVNSDGQNLSQRLLQAVTLCPGTTYELTASARRTTSSGTININGYVQFAGSGRDPTVLVGGTVAATAFTPLQAVNGGRIQVPAGGSAVGALLYFEFTYSGGAGAAKEGQLDEVHLTPVA